MQVDQTTVLARATAEGEADYEALISDLRQIWPDLERIPKQPILTKGGWRGDLGFWVIGHREPHADTGTYKTFRMLGWPGLPLLFLGAYRVREAPVGNLIFIGRHPLPTWARIWNGIGIPVTAGLAILAAYVFTQVW